MRKLIPIIKEIVPGKVVHVIKFCIDDNNYLTYPECAKTFRDAIQVHLLPVARFLGYVISQKTIEIVLMAHPEEVIRKVPRNCKHIHTRLRSDQMMKRYLDGSLSIHNVEDPALLCTDGSVHDVVTKKIATVLQCLTLKYNKCKKRRCRLTQRKYFWHEIPLSKLKEVLSMQGAVSALQGYNLDPMENECTGFSDVMQQDSTLIDQAFLARYCKNLRNDVKSKMKLYMISFGSLELNKDMMLRSSIDWLEILNMKPG
jgi:hypothetical protein